MNRNTPKRNRETITVEEAADIVGCHRKHIYKLIHQKILTPVPGLRPYRVSEAKFRKIVGLELNEAK